MTRLDNGTLLLAFVALTGLAVLLQAGVLLAIYFAMRKAGRLIEEEVEGLRSAVMPVLRETQDMLADSRELLAQARESFERVSPKIEVTANDLAEVAHVLRVEGIQMQSSVHEILERIRRQSVRVDGMLTDLLNSVDRTGVFIANSVSKPIRQINRVMGTVRAVVDTLRRPVGR